MVEPQRSDFVSLMDSWTNFNNEMGNRLLNNVQTQQKEYEQVYSKWMDISRKVGTEVNKALNAEGEGAELYSVWKNYNNKIGNRLNKMVNSRAEMTSSLQKTWSRCVPGASPARPSPCSDRPGWVNPP